MNAVTSWGPILEGRARHASRTVFALGQWLRADDLFICYKEIPAQKSLFRECKIFYLLKKKRLRFWLPQLFFRTISYSTLTAYSSFWSAILGMIFTIFDLTRPITFPSEARSFDLIRRACNMRIRFKRSTYVKHTSRIQQAASALLTPQHTAPRFVPGSMELTPHYSRCEAKLRHFHVNLPYELNKTAGCIDCCKHTGSFNNFFSRCICAVMCLFHWVAGSKDSVTLK